MICCACGHTNLRGKHIDGGPCGAYGCKCPVWHALGCTCPHHTPVGVVVRDAKAQSHTARLWQRRHWSKSDMEYLRTHPEMSNEEIADTLSRTVEAVYRRRWELGRKK